MCEIKKCILCDTEGTPLNLNNLPMFKCPRCSLVWRQEFDVPISHYEKKVVDFAEGKTKSRLDNSNQRIKLFKKYIELNDLCDIGSAEGVFLQALTEQGYKNVVGLEPSDVISDYA